MLLLFIINKSTITNVTAQRTNKQEEKKQFSLESTANVSASGRARTVVSSPRWDEIEPFVNGYAKVFRNKKWNFLNTTGKLLSAVGWDEIRNFKNGLAAVNTGSRWGFIDQSGREIITQRFYIAFDFTEAVTAVYTGRVWQLIDRKGKVLKELDIDYFGGFINGVAEIKKGNLTGSMNKDGVIQFKSLLSARLSTTQTANRVASANISPGSCFPNIDFESGSFKNWSCFIGNVKASGSTNVIKVSPSSPTALRHTLISQTTPSNIDPYGLFPVNPPNGSNYAVKLGNTIVGGEAERVRYVVTVPSNAEDFSIIYQYAVVFEDPSHAVYQQPRFTAKLYDPTTEAYIDCASFEYIATSNLPGFHNSQLDPNVKYKTWTPVSINLTPYAGKTLYLEFTTADCTQLGHWGYAYLDVQDCGNLVQVNYQCDLPHKTTLTAPSGFQTYKWWDKSFKTVVDSGQSIVLNPGPPIGANYWVEVIPFNGFGCRDTFGVEITAVFPAASFTFNPSVCSNNDVTFTNTSVLYGGTMRYLWDFGDGSTSTAPNPVHKYDSAGTYTIQLIAFSNDGCSDTAKQTIVVKQSPEAAFTINNSSQCQFANNFKFINASQSKADSISYNWLFGDGSNSAITSPNHSYQAIGTYTVSLNAKSSNGCSYIIDKTISVIPNPVATFTVNDVSKCVNSNFVLTNTTSLSGVSAYQWLFGDGSSSSSTNAFYSYKTSGNYTIRLIATGSNGCVDTAAKTVTVNPKPVAGLKIDSTNHCIGTNSFLFTNTSSVSAGTLAYQWNFGDATTSTVQSPIKTYSTEGSYYVSLIAITNNGCVDTSISSVTVYPKPSTLFVATNNGQCVNNNSFKFTNTSTLARGSLTYFWDFGDGKLSTEKSPTHSYSTIGNFTVKLISKGISGCMDSATKSIVIYPEPTATFTTNNALQCAGSNNFVFTNTSFISNGSLNYLWSFGDGTTSSEISPNHAYAASNSFQVIMVATSTMGCKDTITKTLTVNPIPAISFSVDTVQQCLPGNSFNFKNKSTISRGSISYAWDFGDLSKSNTENPSHTYLDSGTYIVKLISYSSQGCKDSMSNIITVYPKPTAQFSVNADALCFSENRFNFTNSSSGYGTLLSTKWDFGDNNTSLLLNPQHNYSVANTFLVKLSVRSSYGCTDSATQTIRVYPNPVARFNINHSDQCINTNNCTLTNKSVLTGENLSFLWNFGDGNTSNAAEPSHVFTSTGTFPIKLIATSVNGCKDSITINTTIHPNPSASFTVNNQTSCFTNNSFTFTNKSTFSNDSVSYLWSLGDGTTSTVMNPSYTYRTTGVYKVKLIVTSAKDCIDSMEQTVTLKPKPFASFSINKQNQCVDENNFAFKNNSTIADGQLSYNWSFDDGQMSHSENVAHRYDTSGSYEVKLIVSSEVGCTDTVSKVVTVFTKPVPIFSIDTGMQCLVGNHFTFTNNSHNETGLEYCWDFGDGKTAIGRDESHSYANAGSYNVKMRLKNATGCRDSVSQQILVNAMPVAAVISNKSTTLCLGDSILLTSASVAGSGTIDSYQWFINNTQVLPDSTNYIKVKSSGAFTLRVTNSNGCSASSPITTVLVNELPRGNISNASLINLCEGEFIKLSVSAARGYQWYLNGAAIPDASKPDLTTSQGGTYTVMLENSYGCKSMANDTATVIIRKKPTIELGADKVLFTGNTQRLFPIITNGPIIRWNWVPSTNLSCSNCAEPIVTAKENIGYTATVTNLNGCTAYDNIKIKVFCEDSQVFIPNLFTPDNNGVNDILTVRATGIKTVNSFRIFNRWGQLVFEKFKFPPNDKSYGWNGKVQGVKASPDVFVYTAEVVCDNNQSFTFKGNVTIIR